MRYLIPALLSFTMLSSITMAVIKDNKTEELSKTFEGSSDNLDAKIPHTQSTYNQYEITPDPKLLNSLIIELKKILDEASLKVKDKGKTLETVKNREVKQLTDEKTSDKQDTAFPHIQSLYQQYQTKPDPKVKTAIIIKLKQMLDEASLKFEDKDEALKIAKNLEARHLTDQVQAYTGYFGNLSVLPKELIAEILGLVSQGMDINTLKNLLRVNKAISEALLSAPVHLDLTPFRPIVTDDTLVLLVALFPKMQALNLNYCYKLTDRGFLLLQNLRNLRVLQLRGTKITDAGLVHLQNLINLTNLDLTYTKLTDAGLVHLQSLINLTHLNLGFIKITGVGLAQLQKLPKLTDLDLTDTQLTDKELAHLQKLPNLTYLTLSADLFYEQNDNVTSEGLGILKTLPKLKEIRLSANRLEKKDIKKLQRWIPGVNIIPTPQTTLH